MRLSIFSRLVVGYCVLLILLAGASVHLITQSGQVRHVTRSIISAGNDFVVTQKKLTDILLSEIRYEKKFLIIKDAELYSGFLRATEDFEEKLQAALLQSDAPEVQESLSRISQSHEHYKTLFNQEVESIKAGKKSSLDNYTQEQKTVADSIMQELETLEDINHRHIFDEIKALDDTETRSGKIAFAMAAASLLFGITLSALITRSITSPIAKLKKKTSEIASGIFSDNLHLTSPPEFRELASAFNNKWVNHRLCRWTPRV